MKIFCKDDALSMVDIITALFKNETVEVHNTYETLYGIGFDNWLRGSLKNFPCTIEVLEYDNKNDYPRSYLITPSKR